MYFNILHIDWWSWTCVQVNYWSQY